MQMPPYPPHGYPYPFMMRPASVGEDFSYAHQFVPLHMMEEPQYQPHPHPAHSHPHPLAHAMPPAFTPRPVSPPAPAVVAAAPAHTGGPSPSPPESISTLSPPSGYASG